MSRVYPIIPLSSPRADLPKLPNLSFQVFLPVHRQDGTDSLAVRVKSDNIRTFPISPIPRSLSISKLSPSKRLLNAYPPLSLKHLHNLPSLTSTYELRHLANIMELWNAILGAVLSSQLFVLIVVGAVGVLAYRVGVLQESLKYQPNIGQQSQIEARNANREGKNEGIRDTGGRASTGDESRPVMGLGKEIEAERRAGGTGLF
ncbi:hypothetical protein K435DRAFT_803616 [Dendrothele bispora CBS 962.96]|uniref:Uncharacterized protein n=1 Tax=Dendrothele bispora (strain CBS 962.96) TaxID=1314807 RepID=A0A4S8LGR9_DENBC|nr:hypothetical protein K435DRAFT_803616 [Dendrothele bispora CBS 962.96]